MEERIYKIDGKPFICVALTSEQIIRHVFSCNICHARNTKAKCLSLNGFMCKPYTRLVELSEGV